MGKSIGTGAKTGPDRERARSDRPRDTSCIPTEGART